MWKAAGVHPLCLICKSSQSPGSARSRLYFQGEWAFITYKRHNQIVGYPDNSLHALGLEQVYTNKFMLGIGYRIASCAITGKGIHGHNINLLWS